MKIKNIQINGFGKLEDKSIDFDDKLNIVVGANESGKSTMVDFIKSMLYGINKNKAGNEFSETEKFKPWKDIEFSGKMTCDVDGIEYSIFREFNKNNAKIYDVSGNEITKQYGKDKSRGATFGIDELGIDEDTFVTTSFVRQGATSVDIDSQKMIIQKLTNMIQSGDENVSYENVLSKLQKLLYEEVGTDRTQNKPKNLTIKAIAEHELEKEKLSDKREKEEYIKSELERITSKITGLQKENDDAKAVYAIREKYQNQLMEKRTVYEAEQKVLEKQRSEEAKMKKQDAQNNIILMSILIVLIVAVSLIIKKYLLLLGLLPVIGALIFFIIKAKPKEEMAEELNQFDLVVEELKKKENKEIEKLEESGVKKSLLDRKMAELKPLIEGYEKNINDYILQEHKYKIEQEALASGVNKLNEIEEELEYLYEKQREISDKEETIKMTMEVLESSYEELKADVLPDITEEIKESIKKTTNGEYTNIKYSDTNGIVIENKYGEIITVSHLSIGTIDQIYLGFRLAIANKLGNLPIILDETFSYYDDTRLENILKVLSKISETNQVIILSCSNREKEISEKAGIQGKRISL